MTFNPFNWFRRSPSPLDEMIDALCFSLTTQTNQWKADSCSRASWWCLQRENVVICMSPSTFRDYIVRADGNVHSQLEFRSRKLDAAILKWMAANITNTLFLSDNDRAAWLLASQAAKITEITEKA